MGGAGRTGRNPAPHRRLGSIRGWPARGGDGLEGRVRRWREVDDALPQSVEAEEEWDFSGADDGADALHGGLPTGALERVGAPDAEGKRQLTCPFILIFPHRWAV